MMRPSLFEKKVPAVPSKETCLRALAKEIRWGKEDLNLILAEGMPALQAHNRRTADIISWHYGLGDEDPIRADAIARRLKIGRQRLFKVHDAGIKFLHDYHMTQAERMPPPAVYGLPVQRFFRLRRCMEQLHDLPVAERYKEARRINALLCWRYSDHGTLGKMVMHLKGQDKASVRSMIGPRALVILTRILASVGVEMENWGTSGLRDHRKKVAM